jgi:DNA-binding XRE family transcriptional regulator
VTVEEDAIPSSTSGVRQSAPHPSLRLGHDPASSQVSPVLRTPARQAPRRRYGGAAPPRGARRPSGFLPQGTPGGYKPPATTLGARLRALRLAAGFTQKQMAAALGIVKGGGRVSDFELGHHIPTLATLSSYAHAFEMTLSALFEGVE